MLNIIWIALLLIGIIVGAINGRIVEVGESLLTSAGDAVTFTIGIAGVMCLWCGLMNIVQKAGGVDIIAKVCRPFIRIACPETRKNPEAEKQVITNICANFLGLGNGATPSGIKAVREMHKTAGGGEVASRGICMFLIINSSSLQLLPTTVIALRTAAGAANPVDILVPTWIITLSSSIIAVIIYSLTTFRRRKVKCLQ